MYPIFLVFLELHGSRLRVHIATVSAKVQRGKGAMKYILLANHAPEPVASVSYHWPITCRDAYELTVELARCVDKGYWK